jgi:TRAP-type C4-dicarboxylate transport system substrate-binding protein
MAVARLGAACDIVICHVVASCHGSTSCQYMLPDLLLPMRYPAQRIRAILVLAALILSVAPAAAQVTSQDASQVTSEVSSQVTSQVAWRMTTEYPENNISGIGLATFASRVSDRTHGFVTVTNAFDNQLKINSGEMPRAALDGRIAGGDAFAGALSGLDPVLGLSTLPFLV